MSGQEDTNKRTTVGDEWIHQFLAEWKDRYSDPSYRAELTTWDMHCGRPDKRYPKMGEETTAWFAEYEAAQAARAAKKREEEEEAAELARQLAIQEHIFSYPDGSVYMGHMRDGKRHGRGTLRTPAFIYGEMSASRYTSDEAAENAHLAKWHEYAGMWEDDKMHGYGINVRKSGDGGEIVIFEGNWVNGTPTRELQYDDEDECSSSRSVSGYGDYI
jgi:hypothetical protein